MAIRSTADVRLDGVKMIVYGKAGVGKTTLIKTLPRPLVLSSERGLLSLRKAGLPYIEINTVADAEKVLAWLEADGAADYESVAVDSATDLAEVLLAASKAGLKDPRQAYGEVQDNVLALFRTLRDLPRLHVLAICKMEPRESEDGVRYVPAMPGKKLGPQVPYLFDEVFHLYTDDVDPDKPVRWLRTQPDFQYEAKDRSGALAGKEKPNLTSIINKIRNA